MLPAVSPSFYSLLPPLSSRLSGQFPTMYSFCGQPALSSSSCLQSQFSLYLQPLSVTSAPIQVTPSFFQQVSSFSSEQKPPSSFACTPAVHSSLPTACPPVHQHYPSPVSRQLPLCQPSSSSMSLSLSSTTVNQPPRGQSTMPPPSSLMVVDPATLGMHATNGFPGQFCTDWLHTLKIPKNIEILDQVKEIWEVGGASCPPLKYWTVLMRNYNSSKGQNTSMYSQRKLIYTLFQRHGFDINTIRARYNELKRGKLHKLLNTKQKVILLAIYL